VNIAEYKGTEAYRSLQSPESLQVRHSQKQRWEKCFTGEVVLHEYKNQSDKSHCSSALRIGF